MFIVNDQKPLFQRLLHIRLEKFEHHFYIFILNIKYSNNQIKLNNRFIIINAITQHSNRHHSSKVPTLKIRNAI